jgi:large subunit ribosomal protein L23
MKDPCAIIQTILITEKSVELADAENKYTFKVHPDANKIEIAKAIESIYGVKVASVNTMNRKGKSKRVGRSLKKGRKADWKKAVVTLAEGEINII